MFQHDHSSLTVTCCSRSKVALLDFCVINLLKIILECFFFYDKLFMHLRYFFGAPISVDWSGGHTDFC